MPRTNPDPDAIDQFLTKTYNRNKFELMESCADGSMLEFSRVVAERLKAYNADWSWRSNYTTDIRGNKYTGGLSGRKAVQVGLGYEWGDDPASAYVMVALAFCGWWNPQTQDAAVVRELLREIFKLKTANLESLIGKIRENEDDILGTVENQIWLHLIALQEHYDFDDDEIAMNTALSFARLEEMQEGQLLEGYELQSLAKYLNKIVDEKEANYTGEMLSQLQLRATTPQGSEKSEAG